MEACCCRGARAAWEGSPCGAHATCVRAGAPADSFYGNGLLGQRVIVVPDQDLVIVRLGLNLNNDFDPVRPPPGRQYF